MIYLKWLFLSLVKVFVLFPSLLVVPQIIAAYTRPMPHDLPSYSWGGLWGTFDNPPQGDEGFCRSHAFFPGYITGWRGYINRVQWMWRNKLYGFNKLASVKWVDGCKVQHVGNENISDKYKVPGWYFAIASTPQWKLIGFEFYAVIPYTSSRDVRIRLGWKMLSDKFKEQGFAPLVSTTNPFDGYGED